MLPENNIPYQPMPAEETNNRKCCTQETKSIARKVGLGAGLILAVGGTLLLVLSKCGGDSKDYTNPFHPVCENNSASNIKASFLLNTSLALATAAATAGTEIIKDVAVGSVEVLSGGISKLYTSFSSIFSRSSSHTQVQQEKLSDVVISSTASPSP